MESIKDINQQHWDEMGAQYSKAWEKPAKKVLSALEMGFVQKFLNQEKPKTVVDIGVGNGRVLKAILDVTSDDTQVYGYDISQEMIDYNKHLFANEEKVKALEVRNLMKDGLPVKPNFVTAIRVLKYNKDWKEIIKAVHSSLNDGGTFVFTMPNRYSLNAFSQYKIPFYKSDPNEIRELLQKIGFELLEMKTFTRIPDVFYETLTNTIMGSWLIHVERALDIVMGNEFGGRMHFVAARRVSNG